MYENIDEINIKEKLNSCITMKWIRKHKIKFASVLTDDLDSLIACKYLKDNYSIPIGAFYNKRALYESCLLKDKSVLLFVDCDLYGGGFTIGNHYTPDNDNEFAVNPNMFLKHDGTPQDYYSKYAGSTSAMLFALDGLDDLEIEQLELLILLDGWYKQLYKYPIQGKYYIEQLEMNAIEELHKLHDLDYWQKLVELYGTNKKIIPVEKGRCFYTLDWEDGINEEEIEKRFKFNISLPEERFYITETYTNHFNEDINKLKDICREKVRSIAETTRDKVGYSVIDSIDKCLEKAHYDRIYIGGDEDVY